MACGTIPELSEQFIISDRIEDSSGRLVAASVGSIFSVEQNG